ncbi:MAG: hypothetical protein HY363_00825 [Candidatus Aenigmarchaeota archaeon]|nr:hypothetical protein [Candidatus Aenigmarchaeota archaeon]
MTKEELEALLGEIRKTFTPAQLAAKLGLDELILQRSCMSDKAILRALSEERIVIHPFVRDNLKTTSYDVTLGPNYYREKDSVGCSDLLNPYDEKSVRRIWQLYEADSVRHHESVEPGLKFESGIRPEDRIIIVAPGETILAHTMEFIGGRGSITTMMKARSSLGRNFIEVCKCAGWGDVDYFNRWTMEITNNSRYYKIPLVVGRRVAQIIFFETEPIREKNYVQDGGKYQSSLDVRELERTWSPDAMLPKLWKDREAVE